MRRLALATLALAFAACSSDEVSEPALEAATETPADSATPESTAPISTDPATTNPPADPETDADAPGDDRPFEVFVPSSYDPATPMPLVLLLHGYTGTGESQEAYFEFEPLAESRGFLYVHPDGTVDPSGEQFWNATDACCAFGPQPPDDQAYLLSIIDQVSADYTVDQQAVFIAGHSNGGFMSYRMACNHADRIAGIASLAGAMFADPADCTPSEPVTVLQIHGTDDDVIFYDGGSIIGNPYPSARESIDFWADHNGCDTTPTLVTDGLDLVAEIDGADSDVEAFDACDGEATVGLWTINDGVHTPDVTAEFSAAVVDFLLANPKR